LIILDDKVWCGLIPEILMKQGAFLIHIRRIEWRYTE